MDLALYQHGISRTEWPPRLTAILLSTYGIISKDRFMFEIIKHMPVKNSRMLLLPNFHILTCLIYFSSFYSAAIVRRSLAILLIIIWKIIALLTTTRNSFIDIFPYHCLRLFNHDVVVCQGLLCFLFLFILLELTFIFYWMTKIFKFTYVDGHIAMLIALVRTFLRSSWWHAILTYLFQFFSCLNYSSTRILK